MNNNLIFANSDTPTPGNDWLVLNDLQRLSLSKNILKLNMESYLDKIEIISAKADGQVIVRLSNIVPADERGTLLLNIEEAFKNYLDKGIVVWLEALNDKSPLRRLRGIGIKT
jgi:hypothetical protein